jgi:hypothetical protein
MMPPIPSARMAGLPVGIVHRNHMVNFVLLNDFSWGNRFFCAYKILKSCLLADVRVVASSGAKWYFEGVWPKTLFF